jgi:GAF domain-containing protein
MADQIAIAVQNAQTLNRAEQQARTLATLNQMSRDLALATSLDTIARVTAQTVIQLLGPNRLSLALKSSDPAFIGVRAIDPAIEQALGEAQLMPAANTLIGEMFETGQTRYSPDLTVLAQHYQDAASLSSLGMRSLVSVPLKVGNRSVGELIVGNDQPEAYTTDYLSQLEQIAAQMAIAIENHNLAEKTQRALSELDAANRRLIGQAWEHYTRTTDVIQGEWRDDQWIAVAPNTHPIPAAGRSLAVPLRVRGETVGEFNVQTEAQRNWTPDDVAFAQALIDQVGQVIENARLLEETERFAQREQRIHQITTRIRAAGSVQAVLEATTTELAQSLGVSRAIMRLTMSDAAPLDDQPRPSHETAA